MASSSVTKENSFITLTPGDGDQNSAILFVSGVGFLVVPARRKFSLDPLGCRAAFRHIFVGLVVAGVAVRVGVRIVPFF
jgi:hypothetical protein